MKNEASSAESASNDVIAHHGHQCDGIQEFDNPLPGWWKGLFWSTILFSLFYLGYFHAGASGRSIDEQYMASLAANMKKQYGEIGELEANEATILTYMKQPKWVTVGGAIFKANCVSCHGADGGGNVGPNLCDDQYKHVKQVSDIAKVVNEGVVGGAMPAWGTRLGHKNDLVLVSAYVATLRGSKPANPKAPDGSPIAPWPSAE